jgi:hypothetical protein
MNSPTVVIVVPAELTLTLRWIDSLLAADGEIARAVFEDGGLSAELMNLQRSVELGAFVEANAALDAILEKFALAQAIAFERMRGSCV